MANPQSTYHAQLGAAIRELRERRGLSSKALGDKCGLDQSYVRRVERGEMNLVFDTLLVFAAALKTSPGALAGRARLGEQDLEWLLARQAGARSRQPASRRRAKQPEQQVAVDRDVAGQQPGDGEDPDDVRHPRAA
jgi:transcriptional regulator with XRE-family HTH domain